MLEGAHHWGELEVWTSRYGYTSHCLVVWPPGATRGERIRFRAIRVWPPLGLLVGLLVFVVAGQTLPLVGAAVLGGLACATGAGALALLAGPARRQVRILQTCRGDEGTSALDRGPHRALEELSDRMLTAEHDWRAGRIDAVHFEAVWHEVWRALGARSLQHR